METKLMQLVLEKLSEEQEKLKKEIRELRSELMALKSTNTCQVTPELTSMKEDELLDYKDVQKMLNMCYNSVKKLVDSGQILAVRLNKRSVRFSKQSILNYFKIKSTLS